VPPTAPTQPVAISQVRLLLSEMLSLITVLGTIQRIVVNPEV
jgi:hypothetical protein